MRLLIGVMVFIGFGILAGSGALYQNGQQWYEQCWYLYNSRKGINQSDPSSPEQAAAWSRCEPVAEAAIYEQGIIFASSYDIKKDDKNAPLLEACPDSWTEMPVGGIYIWFVKGIEQSGGVSLLNKLLPASLMLADMAEMQWPNCNTVRRKLGFPRIVKKNRGSEREWGWESKCVPCQSVSPSSPTE